MALDKDHLFEGFATLQLTKNPCKRRSQVLRFDRIEALAHRRITRYPSDAVNALQIVLGAFLVKGEQRGRFEGEHGEGGHQGIAQRDVGIAFSVIGNLTKDVLNRAQQGIGTQMFSHFGNHEAHSNLQPKMAPLMSREPHFGMAVYEKTSGNT
jgi:hypothetical protein